MSYLKVSSDTTLRDLSDIVGYRNVESMLHLNSVDRVRNIGAAFQNMCESIISSSDDISYERKMSLINKTVGDSDIFETVALLDESGWKLLSNADVLPNYMQIPNDVTVPDNINILGNGEPIGTSIHTDVLSQLYFEPHSVDPSTFLKYHVAQSSDIMDNVDYSSGVTNPLDLFHIPWGEVTLYSSLGDESVDFPVYPEEMSDGYQASYTTMPEMIYQYEPWYLYNSSGPRSNTYTFDFHRDMWTGDHRDGLANNLIRFCEANCYPHYQGSAVYTSTVTLYISGYPIITGILTAVNVSWDGPLGLDGYYLHCKLELSITEVSKDALDYNTVRTKSLIG